MKVRTVEDAKRLFPGEALYQCDRCKNVSSYGNAPPPPGVTSTHAPTCGGTIAALPSSAGEPK